MADVWRLELKADQPTTLQAMSAGGRYHFKGAAYVWLFAQTLVSVFFAPIGAMFVIGLALQLAGVIDVRDLPPYAMPATMLILFVFFMWLSNTSWKRFSVVTVSAKFNKHTVAEISETGFTQMAPNSTRRTGWGDVETVMKSKAAVLIVVSGVVQFVPLNAFSSLDSADKAFSTMQGWIGGTP